jgi:hypothetical protein
MDPEAAPRESRQCPVQEDTCTDSEINHEAEEIALVAIKFGYVASAKKCSFFSRLHCLRSSPGLLKLAELSSGC